MTRQTLDSYLTAQEAYQWGIVNKVVPLERLMDTAIQLANEIKEMPPLSIKAIKEAVNRGGFDGYEYSQQVIANLAATGDAIEGAQAFVEKRKPNFKGK